MKKYLVIFTTFISVFVSCTKDTTGVPKPDDYTYAPLYGTWYFKTKITNSTTLGSTVYSTNTNFTAKDYYIFNKDNTYSYSVTAPAAVTTGYYSYLYNGSEILTIGDSRPAGTSYTISKLTVDSLIISTTFGATPTGTVTKVTYKFSHI